MRLLLVEDERRLAEALSHLLKKNGYSVDIALDGNVAFDMISNNLYEIMILDRMLPKIDGLTILKELRAMDIDTPVLFLTAKDSPADIVEGLDAGADDYLVKPFATDELFARLRALIRRRHKTLQNNKISVAGLILDPLKCEVIKDEKIIKLTSKETLLLELLMCNYGQVITKEVILEKVWGYLSDIEISNIDLYIHYLRKKLNTSLIKTVRGIGYCLQENSDVK